MRREKGSQRSGRRLLKLCWEGAPPEYFEGAVEEVLLDGSVPDCPAAPDSAFAPLLDHLCLEPRSSFRRVATPLRDPLSLVLGGVSSEGPPRDAARKRAQLSTRTAPCEPSQAQAGGGRGNRDSRNPPKAFFVETGRLQPACERWELVAGGEATRRASITAGRASDNRRTLSCTTIDSGKPLRRVFLFLNRGCTSPPLGLQLTVPSPARLSECPCGCAGVQGRRGQKMEGEVAVRNLSKKVRGELQLRLIRLWMGGRVVGAGGGRLCEVEWGGCWGGVEKGREKLQRTLFSFLPRVTTCVASVVAYKVTLVHIDPKHRRVPHPLERDREDLENAPFFIFLARYHHASSSIAFYHDQGPLCDRGGGEWQREGAPRNECIQREKMGGHSMRDRRGERVELEGTSGKPWTERRVVMSR